MPDSAKTPSRVEEPQAAYDSTAAAVTAVRRQDGEVAIIKKTMATRSELAQAEHRLRLRLAEMELRLNKAVHRNGLWIAGTILVVVTVVTVAIATAILLAAMPA